MRNKNCYYKCITGKSKVEPQIFFSVKCFNWIIPKKFSPLKYCVIRYEKAADTIYESICTVAATLNDLIIVVALRRSKINSLSTKINN